MANQIVIPGVMGRVLTAAIIYICSLLAETGNEDWFNHCCIERVICRSSNENLANYLIIMRRHKIPGQAPEKVYRFNASYIQLGDEFDVIVTQIGDDKIS